MQFKPSRFCRSLAALALFAIFAQGCGATQQSRLEATDLGTIGVISASAAPEAQVPEATSKLAAGTMGAMEGLGLGLAGALICPLGIVTVQFGGGPAMLGCLIAAGTPVLMIVGAAQGASSWIPQEIETEAGTLLGAALAKGQKQNLLQEQVMKALEMKASNPLVSLEPRLTDPGESSENYSELAGRDIDTVFVLSPVGVGFARAKPAENKNKTEMPNEPEEVRYQDMRFSLVMSASLRVVRVSDNQTLREVTQQFTSEDHRWSEWGAEQECGASKDCAVRPSKTLNESIEAGYQRLARLLVIELLFGPDPKPYFDQWPE